MTRRRIGSKRTSRDSFVDDKTDAALSSVTQLADTVRTKVMRPIGAKPLPPPHLVRNADMDLYIYEGIPWINRGRGIIDPTPGYAQPLNRRLRREAQANLGTPARIVAMRPSPMVTMSHADGPMAAMTDPRILRRPENIYPIDELSGPMQEIETRVDAILGPKPATLKEATDNLKKLENIVNSGVANGNNFLLDPAYFLAQMQPGLAQVSPRFAGPATPMSSYDDGLYYAIAVNLIDYPEAFRDVHLTIATINNPDEVSASTMGGSAANPPSYLEISPKSESARKVPRGVLVLSPDQVRADTGVKDMSHSTASTKGGVATGARLPLIVNFPTYKSNGQKTTKLMYGGQEIGELAIPEDYMERMEENLALWEKVLAATGVARQALIDSTVSSVALGYLQEIQNLQGKISQLKDMTSQTPHPNALQSVRALEQRMSELYSESQKAIAMVTAMHEIGHVLDHLGNYKSSPDYLNAIAKTSGGLNSKYEMQRDLGVAQALAQGLDHPIKADLAENVARKFVKEKLLKMIGIISRRKSLPGVRAMAQEVGDGLMAMDASLKRMLRKRASPAETATAVGSITRIWERMLSHEVGAINRTIMPGSMIAGAPDHFEPTLKSDPAKLTKMAEQAISQIRKIGEDSIKALADPGAREQYDFYVQEIDGLIKAAEERISLFKKPEQRAIALAITAIAAHNNYLKGFNAFMRNTSREMSELQQAEQALAYLAPWFGNNVTQQDMDQAVLDSGRKIMTDLLTINPAMVREFMEIYGRNEGKPWFDGAGAFDATEYLKDILGGGPFNLKGMDLIELLQVINHWHALQGTNGWKNLTDKEIGLVQSAADKLTDYGGPADYDFSIPLPKSQMSTNKETYAELHPMILMRMERMLQKLTAEERRAVERLHEEMIAMARAVINSTNQGGTTP